MLALKSQNESLIIKNVTSQTVASQVNANAVNPDSSFISDSLPGLPSDR